PLGLFLERARVGCGEQATEDREELVVREKRAAHVDTAGVTSSSAVRSTSPPTGTTSPTGATTASSSTIAPGTLRAIAMINDRASVSPGGSTLTAATMARRTES